MMSEHKKSGACAQMMLAVDRYTKLEYEHRLAGFVDQLANGNSLPPTFCSIHTSTHVNLPPPMSDVDLVGCSRT